MIVIIQITILIIKMMPNNQLIDYLFNLYVWKTRRRNKEGKIKVLNENCVVWCKQIFHLLDIDLHFSPGIMFGDLFIIYNLTEIEVSKSMRQK